MCRCNLLHSLGAENDFPKGAVHNADSGKHGAVYSGKIGAFGLGVEVHIGEPFAVVNNNTGNMGLPCIGRADAPYGSAAQVQLAVCIRFDGIDNVCTDNFAGNGISKLNAIPVVVFEGKLFKERFTGSLLNGRILCKGNNIIRAVNPAVVLSYIADVENHIGIADAGHACFVLQKGIELLII